MKNTLFNLSMVALNITAFFLLRNLALGFVMNDNTDMYFMGTARLQNIYMHGIVAGMCMVIAVLFIARLLNDIEKSKVFNSIKRFVLSKPAPTK